MSNAIFIGSRRELFWDEYLIDTEKTTAKLMLHKPQAREVVIDHNEPWEGDTCCSNCIIREDGFYRMYYLAENAVDETGAPSGKPLVLCCAESTDGKKWVKPKLGVFEFNGSRENNIIGPGYFVVFKDPNPDCPKDERYKGIQGVVDGPMANCALWCHTSPDGIHFKKGWIMTTHGRFDNTNTAFWDDETQQYICYIRDYHNVFPPGEDLNNGIRDICWMVSKDFKNWSVPVRLDFGNVEDIPLYTIVVNRYYRAEHLWVGFPSRYVERHRWTPNFDQLPGVARRRKRMEIGINEEGKRFGLALNDAILISSRDGRKWKRWDEAFMTPGPEREYNWVYGDCMPAIGLVETESDLSHAPKELSLYVSENHWGMIPAQLRRHTMRIDGFVSYHATYQPGWFPPSKVVTKPFIFKGGRLSINFATSAAGYVKIRMTGKDIDLASMEMFGDSLDRTVVFDNGEAESLSGQPATMEITMSDADIYSFKFDESR